MGERFRAKRRSDSRGTRGSAGERRAKGTNSRPAAKARRNADAAEFEKSIAYVYLTTSPSMIDLMEWRGNHCLRYIGARSPAFVAFRGGCPHGVRRHHQASGRPSARASESHRLRAERGRRSPGTTSATELDGLPGGGLNIAYECLDRHLKTRARDKPAMLWEGKNGEQETYTFADLREGANKSANALRSLGVEKGDRVFVFLDRIPELLRRRLRHAEGSAPSSGRCSPPSARTPSSDRLADSGAEGAA